MPTGAISKVRPRMRKLQRALLAGGLGFAVSCIAGCGGGAGLLSGDQANTLNNKLSQVSSALTAGHCGAAQIAAQQLVADVANLPGTLNGTLRQNLSDGAQTVSSGAAAQCHPVSSQTTSTPTTSSTPATTTTTTATTTTTPPPTQTTAPTTTPDTSPATTPTPTGTTTGPSGGSGLGGGSGSGSGGGSGGAGQNSGGNGNGNGNGNSNG